MSQNNTKITVYRNTIFNNFYNTLHFDSDQLRDQWFDNYPSGLKDNFDNQDFNMVRDRLQIMTDKNLSFFNGVNYAHFYYEGKRYYAYVVGAVYIQDDVTELTMMIDTLMTYTQGNFTSLIGYVMIDRQHLPSDIYKDHLYYIQSNPDLLKFDRRYRYQNLFAFTNLYVVFSSAVDLEKDFGSVDSPLLPMAKGTTYDRMPSPQQLYACAVDDFMTLNKDLQDYALIAQNISKIAQIPKDMLEMADLTIIKNDKITATVYRFYNNHVSKDFTDHIVNINLKWNEIKTLAYNGSLTIPDHLLVSPNVTIEAFDWSGQKLELNPKELPSDGLQWKVQNVVGHFNEIAFFPKGYKSDHENGVTNLQSGTYLNNAIIMQNFDEIPIMINNYNASMARSSFSRNLQKARTLSGRVDAVQNGSLKDKLFNAYSLSSNVTSGVGIPTSAKGVLGAGVGVAENVAGMANNEYELSRDLKVQQQEMSIESPTITSQAYHNALQTKEQNFGLTIKLSAPDDSAWEMLIRYYGKFGVPFNKFDRPQPITSMTQQNFLKFSGVWTLPSVPVEHMSVLNALFEAGVHFYHDMDYLDDFTMKDPADNHMK